MLLAGMPKSTTLSTVAWQCISPSNALSLIKLESSHIVFTFTNAHFFLTFLPAYVSTDTSVAKIIAIFKIDCPCDTVVFLFHIAIYQYGSFKHILRNCSSIAGSLYISLFVEGQQQVELNIVDILKMNFVVD
ncbi:hypothetical protein GQX74_003779 [Glossina fuscipes]|nr:hypothetical protein GQX74_003779 [Glossina fuscipes]